jgi:hypothetical protein
MTLEAGILSHKTALRPTATPLPSPERQACFSSSPKKTRFSSAILESLNDFGGRFGVELLITAGPINPRLAAVEFRSLLAMTSFTTGLFCFFASS